MEWLVNETGRELGIATLRTGARATGYDEDGFASRCG